MIKFCISRGWLLVFILLAAWPILLPAQTSRTVAKVGVEHVGPPAASDELIKSNIRVKPGDAYLRARVDDDVRNLYGTGFFSNIQVTETNSAEGVTVTYVLQGKPLLTDIKFSGNNKFSRSKLLKKITSKVGQPKDERKLFTDSQEIQKAYQKVGYQKTTVEPKVVTDERAGRASVTFEIKESPKIRVVDVVFEGASAFSQKKLRKEIKTRRHWMFSWLTSGGVFKDDQFEEDKDKLVEFYQDKGYIDFEITDVKFEYSTPTKLLLRFVISEGRQYKVGAIDFKGNNLFTAAQITVPPNSRDGKGSRLKMTVGKTFTPTGLNKDVEAVRDYYGARGYIDARVVAVKNANIATGTMDLVYQIDEGEKAYIEKIEIKGNTKTKDKVIRRELAVTPGEVYDMVRVKLSKARLEGLNYFEKVDTQSDDTDVPNRKNLVVGVEEKNTGNLTVGAGLSSVDSIVGFIEVSQGNFDLFKPPTFTGGGQKFRLRAQVGTERQDYQISFVEPWFLDRKLSLGVDLYYRDLDFLSDLYSQTQVGGSLSLTRALWSDFVIGRASYTLESIGLHFADGLHSDTQVIPVAAQTNVVNGTNVVIPAHSFTNYPNVSKSLYDERGTRLVSKLGLALAYDTRNHALLPSRGTRIELNSELAGGVLGGDSDFYKLELRTAWYHPGFFDRHIVEVIGRTGVVAPYGDSTRVPLFDRWFLGGAYTLRGYKFRAVGPRDTFGEPTGGGTYVFGSLEYSLPLMPAAETDKGIDRLRFAVFYDIGNVYQNAWDYSHIGNYLDNWGIGLRLNLPIGPLKLDYGLPITHDRNNGGSGRFQFGVGYNREF